MGGIRSVARAAQLAWATAKNPPWVKPGHFYSPLSNHADVQRGLSWQQSSEYAELPGVDLRETDQLALVAQLNLTGPFDGARFHPDNDQYAAADGAIYRAMLRHLQPERIIEVGSGHSTALALDTLASVDLTCIEPHPDRLNSVLLPGDRDRVTVHACIAQDVELSTYEALQAGDILFIDSTHIVKTGSDVVWLFLQVLPRLAPGVIVHVHDIFWPFTYPETWLRERRDWSENYLLHAFLLGNVGWKILFFASWLWQTYPETLRPHLVGRAPSSFWMARAS